MSLRFFILMFTLLFMAQGHASDERKSLENTIRMKPGEARLIKRQVQAFNNRAINGSHTKIANQDTIRANMARRKIESCRTSYRALMGSIKSKLPPGTDLSGLDILPEEEMSSDNLRANLEQWQAKLASKVEPDNTVGLKPVASVLAQLKIAIATCS